MLIPTKFLLSRFNIPTKFCYCPPMPGVTETKKDSSIVLKSSFCRGTKIRTWDPLLPKQVR